MNVNSRWFQLVASLIAMIMIANLQYAWTLFVDPIQKDNGWSLSEVQWAFTLFILCQTWVQPLDGWLIDRMGPRRFVSAAGILCGMGWAGIGVVTTRPALYVLYSIAGIGAALVYSGSIGSALKWFRDRRGLASGIMAAGFGGGTALFIPVILWIIQSRGYRTAFIWTGIVQGLVILVVAQFLRHPPAETTTARDSPSGSAQVATQHYTTGDMLRTTQFYVLYVMFLLMASGGLLVTAQAGPMAESWGIPLASLQIATSLSPVANGTSRIFWGWASDRIGRETTMGIVFLLQAISLVLVVTLGDKSGGWFALTIVLVFFTWGEVFSLFPATLTDYFGSRHATSNYGILYSAKGVASIIAGGIAAMLYEATGAWSAALYGCAVLALIAAIMAFVLRTAEAPRRTLSAAPATVK